MVGPLAGLRVLDISEGIAAPFCAKLLGDLGADVVKVEPPEVGDRSRALGPFPHAEAGAEPDRERSAAAERIFIRAGLVGADPSKADWSNVLSRTIRQLDRARADGVELAIDAPVDDAADDEPRLGAAAAAGSQVKA